MTDGSPKDGSPDDGRHDRKVLSPVWTLRRDDRNAVCYVAAGISGHVLCLTVGGDPMWRHACRTEDELIEIQRQWRAALKCRGWKTSGLADA